MIRNLESGTATLSSSVVKDNIISTLKELDSLIVGFGYGLEHVETALILRHYACTGNVVSNEELTEHSNTVWVRTEASARKALVNLKSYSDVIVAGTKRLSEELTMLGKVGDGIKLSKPVKDTITLKNPTRFTINGKFEPVNVRPILSEFQNLMDFNDKVLIPYAEVINSLLETVEFNEKFLSGYAGDPSAFSADKWLKGLMEVTNDERFKEGSNAFKGPTFNANRAIYYQGPISEFPKEHESVKAQWELLTKSLSSIKFKCLSDIAVKVEGGDKEVSFKVSNINSIKQRTGILEGVMRRMLAKANNINVHLDNIDKTLNLCSAIMGKAKDAKVDSDNTNYPSENKVFIDSLALLRNEIRLTFEYYNVTSMFLKIIGSLAYICDVELKTYSAPVVKPTEENTEESNS